MKRTLICLILLSIFSITLFAGIEEDINDYHLDDNHFNGKARNLLADEIETGNFIKVYQITDLILNKYRSTDSKPFTHRELFVIALVTNRLDLMINERLFLEEYNPYSYYWADRLFYSRSVYDNAYRIISTKEDFYRKLISDSDLSQEEKDFAKLYLFTSVKKEKNVYVIGADEKGDEFLQKYPKLKYRKYIRNKISILYKPSPLGFGGTMYLNHGNPTYQMEKYFEGNIGFCFDIYVTFKGLSISYIHLEEGFESKKVFHQNEAWVKDENFKQTTDGLQLGPRLRSTEKFSFEPHIFLGFSSIDWVKKNKKKKVLSTTPTTGLGLSIYYQIKKGNFTKSDNHYSEGGYYLSATYDYYNPFYNLKYDDYDGGVWSLGIGVGYYLRPDWKVE